MSYNVTQIRKNLQQMEDLLVRIVNLSQDVDTLQDVDTRFELLVNSLHELRNLIISVRDQIDQMRRNKDKTRELYQIQAEFVALNRRIIDTLQIHMPRVLTASFSRGLDLLNESESNQSDYSTSKKDHSRELQTTPLLDQSMNNQYMNNQYMNERYMNERYMNDQYMNDLFNSTIQEIDLYEKTCQNLKNQINLIICVDHMTSRVLPNKKIENEQLDIQSSHQSSSRKALCVIFIIIIIVALGIGAFFLIQYLRKGKK